jgi:endonuclease YncB( thermonuclease family)
LNNSGQFLAILTAMAMAVASPAAAQPQDLIFCHSPGITDGDTFRCDGGVKIRLWGVDAPERNTPKGPAATRALAEITHGQSLVCQRKGKSYDRIVAQCFIGRRDVAAEMVRRGHAVDLPRFSKGLYAKEQRR